MSVVPLDVLPAGLVHVWVDDLNEVGADAMRSRIGCRC